MKETTKRERLGAVIASGAAIEREESRRLVARGPWLGVLALAFATVLGLLLFCIVRSPGAGHERAAQTRAVSAQVAIESSPVTPSAAPMKSPAVVHSHHAARHRAVAESHWRRELPRLPETAISTQIYPEL